MFTRVQPPREWKLPRKRTCPSKSAASPATSLPERLLHGTYNGADAGDRGRWAGAGQLGWELSGECPLHRWGLPARRCISRGTRSPGSPLLRKVRGSALLLRRTLPSLREFLEPALTLGVGYEPLPPSSSSCVGRALVAGARVGRFESRGAPEGPLTSPRPRRTIPAADS
jgi:hypothetical protein